MDRKTVSVYENEAGRWIAQRRPGNLDGAKALAPLVEPGGWTADLGCGPGWHSAVLGSRVVALDAAFAMLRAVPERAPHARPVQGDLEALPFRWGALAGAWASASYLHVPSDRMPLALAELHRALRVGAPAVLSLRAAADRQPESDEFPGRLFAEWTSEALTDVVHGAGFEVREVSRRAGERAAWLTICATRARSLPDTVDGHMRLLVVGLNPSEYAAEAGCGFARPGNRFWPAALAAGLVTRDRDPLDALRTHGVGMTDFVKRATRRAQDVSSDEYRSGAARVERLVRRLAPRVVCFAGLSGYRVAIGRGARPGLQPEPFGGRPAYLMPNPSGVNTHVGLQEVSDHLRAALALA